MVLGATVGFGLDAGPRLRDLERFMRERLQERLGEVHP